jgi:hypothetical protein
VILRNIDSNEFLTRAIFNTAPIRRMEYNFLYECLCKLDIITILDFGCCESKLGNVLGQLGYKSYGIDINDYIGVGPTFNFIKDDINSHDFGNIKFDAVVAISTLEHIGLPAYGQKDINEDNDIHSMNKIYYYLSKKGHIILTAPYGNWDFDPKFSRTYSDERLERLVENYNIIIDEYYAEVNGQFKKIDKKQACNIGSCIALLLEKK